MKNLKLACLGAGNMGGSLIGGLIADGYNPKSIWATNTDLALLQDLHQRFNIHITQNNCEAALEAEIILLAVKPTIMATVVTEIADIVAKRRPLIISIAAGVREPSIQQWLNCEAAIVRCMPNTPALLRCGATALYANTFVTPQQKQIAEKILQAVGITAWLEKENDLDMVTALSGSGPAYFFLIIEILQQIAEQFGLPLAVAKDLILQTAVGAARMAKESGVDVQELRRRVTSPGGTTEAAIKVLEAGKLRELFFEAINNAKQRAIELGKSK